MMKYYDMVKTSPNKSEKIMWNAIRDISELLEKHPAIGRSFLMKQYKMMHGHHFCEQLARDVVDEMYHYDGDNKVSGELISADDAMMLVVNKDTPEEWRWDAYVAANSFAHDLAGEGLSKDGLLKLAKRYWFGDVDFAGGNKIFWYYSNMD